MVTLSYHASHEQFKPSDLLTFVKLAETAGFDGCHASDHFHPWSEQQGQSGFVYSWLGSALEATNFPFSLITAPGQRYHPAIIAQAIGTLLEMYQNRLTVSLGSGEALNECITGEPWPEKKDRNSRLLECATIIKRLLQGEEVTHNGLVTVKEAKLYTRPDKAPSLMCAALSTETATWAGGWADGLLTVYQPDFEDVVNAFRSNGGSDKPIHVKLTFSYSRDEQFAKSEAYQQWRFSCIERAKLADLSSIKAFDLAANKITAQQVASQIPISSLTKDFLPIIKEIADAGIENIVLHNVARNQEEFISDFGNEVLPLIK